ncbi:dTDP-4-dehydrorhamnose 3,5-epimerase-like enzyme [Paenibacillus sp. RC254]
MFKHRPRHCHFPKPRKRFFKKIFKTTVTTIKFEPKVKRRHFTHVECGVLKGHHHHHRKHRHHRHHDCHRCHHKFF